MASSKYKLNQTGESWQPCLTPWVMTLESSDIPLTALILIMFDSRPQNIFAIKLWRYGVFGDSVFLTKVTYLVTFLRRFFPVVFWYHNKTNTWTV